MDTNHEDVVIAHFSRVLVVDGLRFSYSCNLKKTFTKRNNSLHVMCEIKPESTTEKFKQKKKKTEN